jgi:CheY-like chemotaxis protein
MSSARILVLDDDPMIRRVLERVAKQTEGVMLVTVATPEEVLGHVAEHEVDLVVCDYQLRLRGRTITCAALVSELRARGIAVAVMTGSARAITQDLGVPILEKPLQLADLITLAKR